MPIIAVVQQKGGAGKTPTAIHLAHALSYTGQDTLLVDADPQGTASLHLLGPTYRDTQPTIYNALINLTPIEPIAINEHLYLLPAHSELEKAEIELPRPGAFYQVQLKNLLKKYGQRFKYIVLDTPGSRVSIFATLALTAADIAVVTCKTEYSHQDATQETMNLIEDIREGLNPGLVVWGILPTQYESNVRHHQEVLEMIKEDIKDPAGQPYPVYPEPSRKTTRYNDATSMRIDARLLDPGLGAYWDRIAASVIEKVG